MKNIKLTLVVMTTFIMMLSFSSTPLQYPKTARLCKTICVDNPKNNLKECKTVTIVVPAFIVKLFTLRGWSTKCITPIPK